MIFGVVANGHRSRRASATWLEARAALAQITNLNAEKDKELSFRKEGNGSFFFFFWKTLYLVIKGYF